MDRLAAPGRLVYKLEGLLVDIADSPQPPRGAAGMRKNTHSYQIIRIITTTQAVFAKFYKIDQIWPKLANFAYPYLSLYQQLWSKTWGTTIASISLANGMHQACWPTLRFPLDFGLPSLIKTGNFELKTSKWISIEMLLAKTHYIFLLDLTFTCL